MIARNALLGLCVALVAVTACATNPATGKRQLSLISEAQEIQLGRESAKAVQTSIGLLDDQGLQAYVQQIARRQAVASERPNLPWEFHVVDDPAPNAFALPGGFIYVTRGMLNLMMSEAELASVLGHEIGHVTARHSVNQVSKQQLAQLGLGLGGIFFPEVRPFGQLLGAGLELLFLKYSRDDEREADELGFEYMRKQGYDVTEFDDVFAALERAGDEQRSALPGWLATHPAPAERVENARARAAAAGPQPNARVERDAYLRRIDNLVYGKDPRDGFFRQGRFYHPRLRFQLAFPSGWQTENLTQAVIAVAPENRAVLQLTLTQGAPDRASQQFFSQQGVARGRSVQDRVNGNPAMISEFQAQTEQGVVQGLVGFIAYGNRTYQVIGYTSAPIYGEYGAGMEATIRSFAAVSDPAILNVQPLRLDVVQAPGAITVDEFARRFESAVPPTTLALINQLPGPDSRLPAGMLVKRVVGTPIESTRPSDR